MRGCNILAELVCLWQMDSFEEYLFAQCISVAHTKKKDTVSISVATWARNGDIGIYSPNHMP